MGDGVTTNGSLPNNAVTDNGALIFANPSNMTFAGAIGGNGQLAKTGAGFLLLSASNTYTGATSVSTGVLQVNYPLATSGIALSNGGQFVANIANAWTLNGAITGTGSVVKSGAATLTLSGNGNNFSGGLTVNNGEVYGDYNSVNNSTIGAFGTGTITINAGGTVEYDPNNGVGSTSTVTLANNVVLNGGTYIGGDGLQHLTGTINVTAASTVESEWTGKNVYLDGQIIGSGGLNLADVGNGTTQASTIYITNNANTFSGVVTVNSGTSGSSDGLQLVVSGSTALQYATVNVLGTNTGVMGRRTAAARLSLPAPTAPPSAAAWAPARRVLPTWSLCAGGQRQILAVNRQRQNQPHGGRQQRHDHLFRPDQRQRIAGQSGRRADDARGHKQLHGRHNGQRRHPGPECQWQRLRHHSGRAHNQSGRGRQPANQQRLGLYHRRVGDPGQHQWRHPRCHRGGRRRRRVSCQLHIDGRLHYEQRRGRRLRHSGRLQRDHHRHERLVGNRRAGSTPKPEHGDFQRGPRDRSRRR